MKTVGRLFSYVGKDKWKLFVCVFCIVLYTAASLAGSYMLRPVINGLVSEGGSSRMLRQSLVVMGSIFAVGIIAQYAVLRRVRRPSLCREVLCPARVLCLPEALHPYLFYIFSPNVLFSPVPSRPRLSVHLRFIYLLISAAGCQQLFMPAHSGDPSFFHNQDQIRIHNGTDALRNNKFGRIF